jgi:hypothetical protein
VDPAVAEAIMGNWQEVKKPGVAVLVLDVSGSMKGAKLDSAKAGAKRFLENMGQRNQVGLVTFSDGVQDTVPVGPVGDVRYSVADVVDRSQARGGTALYDAVAAGVRMADDAAVEGDAIRGVVVMTDGQRNNGRVKLSDLVTLTNRSEQPVTDFLGDEKESKTDLVGVKLGLPTKHPIHVFAVALGDDADFDVLRILSEATNSTFSRATDQNLQTILETYGKYF